MYTGNEDQPQKIAHTTITHTFPLRDETDKNYSLDITVMLPRDLTEAESERIADWISSLARDR